MQQAFGVELPQTLSELCSPTRAALVVYDMQVGILGQLPTAERITSRVAQVLDAARDGGYRVFFTRHMSLPTKVTGATALRTAMAWQRVDNAAEISPMFLRDSAAFPIADAVAPRPDEAVLDKIAMSAFVGSPLDIVLRDCGISTVILVGVALEVGIEPTARHAADLGYVPVLVSDACGGGNDDAMQRSLAALRFAGDTVITETAEISPLLRARST